MILVSTSENTINKCPSFVEVKKNQSPKNMNKLLISIAVLLVCVSVVAAVNFGKIADKAGDKIGDGVGDVASDVKDATKVPSMTDMVEGQIWKSK